MKKILLVYPEIPSTYWSFKHALPFINKKASFPPLGLMTIAAMIPKNFDVKLVDLNVENLNYNDIISADMVFVSAMIIQKKSFANIVNICNQYSTPVIAGGPYATSSSNEITGVDHFILNEAEVTLPLFFEDLSKNSLKKIYTSEIKPDIKTTPVPRFDIIDVNKYSNMAVQFSRGCPFNCEFCDIIEMFGRKTRTKNIDQFIKEIDAVYESGFRGSLFIVDDNFIGNKKEVKKLLPEIIKWQKEHKYPFTLFTEASINLGDDDELLTLMAKAAFDMVFIGIESPDSDTLALSQKGQNAKSDMLENIKNIQKKGIEVTGGFIVGFDNDTEAIFDSQINFIKKSSIPLAMVGLMLALPNTQLYRRLKKENRLIKASDGNNTHDLNLNFIPKIPQEKLIAGYKNILENIYSAKSYFDRSFNLLKLYPRKRIFPSRLTLNDLRAFFLSLYKQILSKYSFTYLKFLLKTLFYNYRLFPEAIRMSIKGYHFFKITNDILEIDDFTTALNNSIISFKNKAVEIFKEEKTKRIADIINLENKIKKELRKKYQKLNKNLQRNLTQKIESFDNYCNALINYWYQAIETNKDLASIQLFPGDYEIILEI